MKQARNNLEERMYTWTIQLIQTIDSLSRDMSSGVIAHQLMRSGTSVCANYTEGKAASSRKDFINYLHIALKSANESKYWISLLKDTKKLETEKAKSLLIEMGEISNILAASLITLKNKK